MKENKPATVIKTVVQLFIVIILVPFSALLISRDWDWSEAWIYAIVAILGFVISRVLAARRHPDLLAERARMISHENVAEWDKPLSISLALGGGLIPIVAGLDHLYGWSDAFGSTAKWLALAIIMLSYAIATWALMENRFFSGVVRLQSERGHSVVTTGPYRIVRHPGYVAAGLTYLATPLYLDSLWGYLPVIALILIIFVRTSREDHFLKEKLDGYQEYAKKTRYRLMPGLW